MQHQANKKLVGVLSIIVVIVIVAILVVVVRHKNNNSVASLTAAQQNTAKAQIDANWQTFFGPSTAFQNRENLLQNGKQFAQIIQSEFAALGQESFSSTIN